MIMGFVETIGIICCAIVMGVAKVTGFNYLEVNVWWFFVLEPLLIVLTMGGALLRGKRCWPNGLALAAFVLATAGTGALTKRAFDYGEQITERKAVAKNNLMIGQWNKHAPESWKIELTTEASYLDRVGVAGIKVLQKYGRDLCVGYFGLNIILYALLFPGIALLFAVLWWRRKFALANWSALIICFATLLACCYIFYTLPETI